MKKFYLFTLFALVSIGWTNAQQSQNADTLLLNETQQNNQIVKRYLVSHHSGTKAMFSLHFQLDVANLVTSFSNNADNLLQLGKFVERLKDTTVHLSSVNIRGYASPDGDHEFNLLLAANRAKTFDGYIDDHYPTINPKVSSQAYMWSDCIDAVRASQIPHKEQVLQIISDSKLGERDKEQALRAHHDAWRYLEANILPMMRCAQICFDYGTDEIFTVVVNVPKAAEPTKKPSPDSLTKPQPIAIIESEETGIIVELPEKEHRKHHKRNK